MDNFQKVVDALAVNNAEEKERDSNLNRNIANLRDSNKAAFQMLVQKLRVKKKMLQTIVERQKSLRV